MNSQKKKACHTNDRLKHKEDKLKDSARIIAESSDPVKLIEAQIEYRKLSEHLYRKNLRVK